MYKLIDEINMQIVVQAVIKHKELKRAIDSYFSPRLKACPLHLLHSGMVSVDLN